MKSKKFMAGLVIVSLLSGLLAGCSSKNNNNGNTAQNDKQSEITISVWNEPNANDELNTYKQAEKATGIKINVNVIPESDYSSKLNQMVSTKDTSSDIYVVWENDIKNFADAKGIISLDKYLSNSKINQSDFIDAVSNLTKGLGSTYGLPWCAATEIMFYNQDMFDAAGIAYPTNDWSYADFLSAAEKLTKYNTDKTTSVYGCDIPNTQTWWAGIGGAGDKVYDPATGQLVIGDGAVSFITDCANMVKKGIMPQPSSDTSDKFAAGKAAMSWLGSWNIGTYSDKLKFNWDIATIPTNKIKYNTLHTGFYTINANSKNQDAAWKVIEWFMGEKGQEITSKSSGNPSALKSIADKGAWKVASATTIENWNAITDSLAAGVFGYTCLPSGVTNNAISLFNTALVGQSTPEKAVNDAMSYAAETIGYTLK
jgi:ABC-type sugar transport system, periplasmic component